MGKSPHPNEVDCKRIERALNDRRRYRYVSPEVLWAENGYRIASPCCSRNVDESGGVIDIARLEYVAESEKWRLYCMEHGVRRWRMVAEFETLGEMLQQLNQDPERIFWP